MLTETRKFELKLIQTAFPRTGKNRAVTGRIPMEFFEMFESEFRAMMRENNLKAIYRGPRVSNARTPWLIRNGGKAATTMRCDATHVLLYRR